MSFAGFELDERLLKALGKMALMSPTPVQAQAMRHALEGKDIVAKAKTGSGKTLAYLLPVVNKILKTPSQEGVKALILVPTKELAQQVYQVAKLLCQYCSKSIRISIGPSSDRVDIVISTPKIKIPLTDAFQSLVIDEADLILSYGYGMDIKSLGLPSIYQTYLMSATLDINELITIARNPVTIDLQSEISKLEQFCFNCEDQDKHVFLFFILKFRLVKGKVLIFVNDIDRSYRLKLYLDQFSIRSSVLNSELPQVSRMHTVQEFNKGVFDFLIATDETSVIKKSATKKTKHQPDSEYGVARGIDFKNIAAVINFDFPTSSRAYTHRIGRTARGDASGTALSFITSKDSRIYAKVEYKHKPSPYQFDIKQLDAFRYRCDDTFRSVTKASIREARLKEIKRELVNSEKLKHHFMENPKDLEAIRHDRPTHVLPSRPHLKHVPGYLLPKVSGAKEIANEPSGDVEDVPFHKDKGRYQKKRRFGDTKKRVDPLKSLIFAPSKKRKVDG